MLGAPDPTSPGGPAPGDIPPGFLDNPAPSTTLTGGPAPAPQPPVLAPIAPRTPIFELTRKYVHPIYRVEYDVQAFAVDPNDRELGQGHPWAFRLTDVATRTYAFLVDPTHDLYRSMTMTPLDALLTELSFRTLEFLRQTAPEAALSSIIADFRREYCVDSRLDPADVITQASNALAQIAQSLPANLPDGEGQSLYDGLGDSGKRYIGRKMIARGVTPAEAIAAGSFLAHADPETIRGFVSGHPDLFFDGKFWNDPYATLDYGVPAMTEEARQLVCRRYDGYMADAVWLASQTPADLDKVGRDALIRASLSLKLLQPDTAE